MDDRRARSGGREGITGQADERVGTIGTKGGRFGERITGRFANSESHIGPGGSVNDHIRHAVLGVVPRAVLPTGADPATGGSPKSAGGPAC
jgi:hypothetical protein